MSQSCCYIVQQSFKAWECCEVFVSFVPHLHLEHGLIPSRKQTDKEQMEKSVWNGLNPWSLFATSHKELYKVQN